MFSFNPLPVIDTLNDHTGFLIMCVVCAVLFVIFLSAIETVREALVCVGIIAILLGVSAYNSWGSGKITIPKNEKVIATFVAYQPEGYNVEVRGGKTTRRVDRHFMYVVYNVPGYGNVILQGDTGQVYPEKAILYKN